VKSGRLFSIMPGYEALDVERRLPGARLFISDYQGGHPFVDDDEQAGDHFANLAVKDLNPVSTSSTWTKAGPAAARWSPAPRRRPPARR